MAEKRKATMSIKKAKSKTRYFYEDDTHACYCTMFEGMSYVIARLAATLQAMEYKKDMQSIVIEVTME